MYTEQAERVEEGEAKFDAEKAEELRKKGFSGMSKHAITRHEHREAHKN
jgi:hypothetical protein